MPLLDKPGTEAIGFKGQPVDEIDRSCKALKSCHTCIELEYSNCDPVTTKYRAKVQRQGDGTLQITCSKYFFDVSYFDKNFKTNTITL